MCGDVLTRITWFQLSVERYYVLYVEIENIEENEDMLRAMSS